MKKLRTSLNIIAVILFLVTAIYYLPILNGTYLVKIQELSIFMYTKLFWQDTMKIPGGLIEYISRFLTQFFYYPWLGTSMLITLLILISFLIYKSFSLNKNTFAAAMLPAWLLLLIPLQLGYMIYVNHFPGFVFTQALGVLLIAGFLLLYQSMKSKNLKGMVGLVAVLSYPFFGGYALFAAILISIYLFITFVKEGQKTDLYTALATVLLVLIYPYVLYRFFYTQIEFSKIYLIGLSNLFQIKFILPYWIPVFLLALYLLILTTVNAAKPKWNQATKFTPYLGFGTFAIGAGLFFSLVYSDANFQTQLTMEKAVFNEDWDEVIRAANKSDEEPTRLILMYTNLALQKKHMAGDYMFKYKQASHPYNYPVKIRLAMIGGKTLYYQYALTNYCYRWCMEDMVEHGPTIDNLRYMVKSALMNGEIDLAKKYNNLLKTTRYHKAWAEEYEKYIEDPSLMDAADEFKNLKSWKAYTNNLDIDNDLVELFLLNYFGKMQGGTDELLELSIQDVLILRNIDLFWPRFFHYYERQKRLPVHYQEAALLFSYLEKKVDVSKLKLDEGIRNRFNQFLKMTKQQFPSEESYNKAFNQTFGDTYWYYYFFKRDLTTS